MPRKQVITWGKHIDRFLLEADIQGLSERTLDSYRWTLSRAIDFWGHDSDPLSITEDDILDVLGRWRRGGCSSTTIANRISCFHTFFRWQAKKYKTYDPAREIQRPRKDKPVKRWLSAGQVEDLLLAAAKNERDQLVVWTYAMTGLRRAELLSMRWRDVDVDACSLRVVLGKGRKGRSLEMPMVLCEFLADVRARLQEAGEYVDTYYVCPRTIVNRGGGDGPTEYFRDQPMAVTQPNKILIRLAREAGIPDPTFVGPHVLRRSFATTFLANSPDKIYELKAALGHSRIDTTESYLAPVDRERVRDAVRSIEWFKGDDA